MNKDERRASRIGLTQLLRVMRAAQREIARRIIEATGNPGRWDAQLAAIESAYRLIRSEWAAYAAREIPKQYDAGVAAAIKVLGDRVRGTIPNYGTVAALVADSVARMNLATVNGQELVEDLFRTTQQAVIEDEQISRRLAQGLIEEATPANLRRVIRSDLYKALSGGQVLVINGRRYQVASYSSTLARTRTREAQSAATLDVMDYAGEDLVRVSSHNTSTPLCLPGNAVASPVFEGSINSISGTHPRYPRLDRRPPFHPNCQHVLTAFIEAGEGAA